MVGKLELINIRKIMKKTLYILAVLLGSLACSKQFVEPVNEEAQDERPTVTVHFSVDVPEAMGTRGAMANTPNIESLWVIEFGASGYYKGWFQCVAENVNANGEAGKKGYSVELPISDNDQTFHFIANPPSTPSYLNQTEIDVINSMTTTGGEAAFWQKIKVVGGVRGIKQTDGSYEPTAETSAKFALIPLIRNFAKISVTSTNSNISVIEYALVNVPEKGYVAPYDTKSFDFAEPYTNISDLSLANLANYAPEEVNITKITNAADLEWVTAASGESLYMYERPVPTENPTCIVVHASNGGTEYYYKIELLNEKMVHVPIYRDFAYTIDMASVGNEAGETSAQAALDNAPFGDVCANLETASLTQIADATSTLYVGTTDYTYALTGGETSNPVFTLFYKFETTMPDAAPFVTLSDPTGNAIVSVGEERDATAAEGYAGWKAVDITLNKEVSGIAKSLLTVSGYPVEGGRPLYRNVYLRVMGVQDLGVTVSGNTATKGSPVTVKVTLPEDLGASLFPINLYIEAEQNSLSANDPKLSAQTGTSQFNGKNTFYFIRTVSNAEYLSNREITCSFQTNKDNAGTNIKVFAERYFNPATVTLP